tara:strand:- start:226 stop:378 length:153 start_codon:yes stop_codon:yes gene_type:complete
MAAHRARFFYRQVLTFITGQSPLMASQTTNNMPLGPSHGKQPGSVITPSG